MSEPDPDEVNDLIEYFTSMSDDRYARALAQNIAKPVPEETAALRSRSLAVRTEAACRSIIATNAAKIQHVLVGMNTEVALKRARIAHFIGKVRREQALVQSIITEADAQRGILRNAGNPRRRAMERLAQLNFAGDVEKGTYRRLLEEEKQAEVVRRRQMKAEARRRARQGEGRQLRSTDSARS